MEPTYHSKNFAEIPSRRRLSSSVCENLDELCFSFTSSDDSFNSNSSKSSEKKNDVNKNCDLSSSDDDNKSNNETDTIGVNTRQGNHKSFVSIVRFLKKISSKKADQNQQQASRSILRRPSEYIYVKGISGIPIRVLKTSPPTSSCHRYVAKN